MTGALSPGEALAQLEDELLVGEHRARIVQVTGAEEQLAAFRALAEALPQRDRLRFVEVVPGCEHELHGLNQERDLLLDEHAALIFLVGARDAARLLRLHANDLTSVFDLSVELTAERAGASALGAVHALRLELIERHGVLDLTGLVPGELDALRYPMETIFFAEAGLQPRHFELLARREAPVLVLAPPGSGKTTALRHACWDGCLRAEAGEVGPVPGRDVVVFVPLSSWYAEQRQRPTALSAWLTTWMEGLAGAPIALEELLPRGVLLLDGLDEVAGTSVRREVLAQAVELHRAGAAVLVSARDHVVDDLRKQETEQWRVERLVEPSQERLNVRARQFARRVAAARHPDDADRADRIGRQVTRAEHREFFSNPLMLTFLVVLADVREELPTWSVELYRDLVELLLHARRGEGPRWRRGELLRVLAPLGWELVQRGVGGLRREELLETLVRLEREREPNDELALRAASKRLDQLVDGTSLLSAADGLYRFQHPTLAEYFAARSVLQDAAHRAYVVEEPFTRVSSTVVTFAVGLVSDLEPDNAVEAELLGALVRRSKRQGRYDSKIPVLLCRLLREVETLPSSVRVRLAEAAVRVALGKELSPWARRSAVDEVFRNVGVPEVEASVRARMSEPGRTAWSWLAAQQLRRLVALSEVGSDRGALVLDDELRRIVTHGAFIELVQCPENTTRRTLHHLLDLPEPHCHAVVWGLWISGATEFEDIARRRALAATLDTDAIALLPDPLHVYLIRALAPAAEAALLRRYPALAAALSPSPPTDGAADRG